MNRVTIFEEKPQKDDIKLLKSVRLRDLFEN